MRIDDTKTKVVLTATRVIIFLEQNKLVQAHGMAQTLANIMEEVIDFEARNEKIPIHNHQWYQAFKAISRMQQNILNGETKQALDEIKNHFPGLDSEKKEKI